MEERKLPPRFRPFFLACVLLIILLTLSYQNVTPPSPSIFTGLHSAPLPNGYGFVASSMDSRSSNQSGGVFVTDASGIDRVDSAFSNGDANGPISDAFFLHDRREDADDDLAMAGRNISHSIDGIHLLVPGPLADYSLSDPSVEQGNATLSHINSKNPIDDAKAADASVKRKTKNAADDLAEYGVKSEPDVSMDDFAAIVADGYSSVQRCDYFDGEWIYDDLNLLYQPAACPFVDEGFRCQENGRPDSAYMNWRWKPYGCNIPRFNATDMLQRLKGKRLVFSGDSLSRNQFESLLCILWDEISDKSRMVEKHGRTITKGQGSYSFKFLDYSCSIEFYRSHFLVYEGRASTTQTQKRRQTLRLDKIDKTHSKWKNADILIFNTGHWWSHTKTAKGRNYFQEGDHIFPTLHVTVAYKKALTTWASWVDKYVDPTHTQVYFLGYSPAHFRGGQWNSGGQCDKETQPIVNVSYLSHYPYDMIVLEEVIKQMRTPVTLLNVTKLSDYRKDAHPSIYGHPETNRKRTQDCSHWCIPGVPDIWNELLYAHLIATLNRESLQIHQK